MVGKQQECEHCIQSYWKEERTSSCSPSQGVSVSASPKGLNLPRHVVLCSTRGYREHESGQDKGGKKRKGKTVEGSKGLTPSAFCHCCSGWQATVNAPCAVRLKMRRWQNGWCLCSYSNSFLIHAGTKAGGGANTGVKSFSLGTGPFWRCLCPLLQISRVGSGGVGGANVFHMLIYIIMFKQHRQWFFKGGWWS